jgi:hypothetical protein
MTAKRPKYRPRRNRLSELAARNAAKPDPANPPRINLADRLFPIIQRHPN